MLANRANGRDNSISSKGLFGYESNALGAGYARIGEIFFQRPGFLLSRYDHLSKWSGANAPNIASRLACSAGVIDPSRPTVRRTSREAAEGTRSAALGGRADFPSGYVPRRLAAGSFIGR